MSLAGKPCVVYGLSLSRRVVISPMPVGDITLKVSSRLQLVSVGRLQKSCPGKESRKCLRGGGGRMSCHLRINADIMMSCPQLCSHHAALGLVWCFHVESSNCFLFFFQQICVEGLSTVCQAMRMQQRAKQRPYPHPTQLLGRETEKK